MSAHEGAQAPEQTAPGAVTPLDIARRLHAFTGPLDAETTAALATKLHHFSLPAGSLVRCATGEYILGVLVQSNFGSRDQLTIAGIPAGKEITDWMPIFKYFEPKPDGGSIIVIVATNAPVLPHQLKRLARRVPLGIARLGGTGADQSGDIFLAFSTANPGVCQRNCLSQLVMLSNDEMSPLFEATIQATEEAILNAMVAATTMVGINGNTVYALPHEAVRAVMQKYNRLKRLIE